MMLDELEKTVEAQRLSVARLGKTIDDALSTDLGAEGFRAVDSIRDGHHALLGYSERNVNALPALLRVARAAERLHVTEQALKGCQSEQEYNELLAANEQAWIAFRAVMEETAL